MLLYRLRKHFFPRASSHLHKSQPRQPHPHQQSQPPPLFLSLTSSTSHHRIVASLIPSTIFKMATSSPPPTDTNTPGIPDSEFIDNDLPLTLASSMILTRLPGDTASALRTAGEFPTPKVTVRFVAIGSAPPLRQKVCRISSAQRFEQVVSYLRRTLKVRSTDSVFLYVNSSFAPALDEIVGNLHGVSCLFSWFGVRGRRGYKEAC